MKRFILCIIMMLTLALPSMSQEVAKKNDTTTVVREGNVFRSNDSVSNSKTEEKTKYEYEDKKGTRYPVYLSKTGKAFIKRKSQKTGREYRQYLPEVGKQINPSAYEEANNKN